MIFQGTNGHSRRTAAWLSLLTLLVLTEAPHIEVAHSATFAVNSTADAVDTSPGNGICATAGGVCTLRAAIQEANTFAEGERDEDM